MCMNGDRRCRIYLKVISEYPFSFIQDQILLLFLVLYKLLLQHRVALLYGVSVTASPIAVLFTQAFLLQGLLQDI
jgi:hypothetical protein